MEKRVFRHTGDEISLLGFGCMRFPKLSENKNDIDEFKAGAMLDHAFANGVNYFDTAYTYHDGLSEAFIGGALAKYPRDSYKLATKMPIWLLEKESDAGRYFETQLKRCGVDYFDFYLVHAVSSDRLELLEKIKLYDYLHREKERGRIRSLGFSFHDETGVLNDVLPKYEWDFAQIQLNYLDWEVQNAKGAYEILRKNEVPVVVMEPVHGGTLANLPRSAKDILSEAEPNASAASWAMRFAAGLPGVLTVLSGMTTMEQVKDNLKTFTSFKPLSEKELGLLERARLEYLKAGVIPCTGCYYCMECPCGVNIPNNFAAYNQFRMNGNEIYMEIAYRALGRDKQARNCSACGKCVPLCPQAIDIPEEMKKIAAAVDKIMEDD